jgi:hypothetical protein
MPLKTLLSKRTLWLGLCLTVITAGSACGTSPKPKTSAIRATTTSTLPHLNKLTTPSPAFSKQDTIADCGSVLAFAGTLRHLANPPANTTPYCFYLGSGVPDKTAGPWHIGVEYVPAGVSIDKADFMQIAANGGADIELTFNDPETSLPPGLLNTKPDANERLGKVNGYTAFLGRTNATYVFANWYEPGMKIAVGANTTLDGIEALANTLAPGAPPSQTAPSTTTTAASP